MAPNPQHIHASTDGDDRDDTLHEHSGNDPTFGRVHQPESGVHHAYAPGRSPGDVDAHGNRINPHNAMGGLQASPAGAAEKKVPQVNGTSLDDNESTPAKSSSNSLLTPTRSMSQEDGSTKDMEEGSTFSSKHSHASSAPSSSKSPNHFSSIGSTNSSISGGHMNRRSFAQRNSSPEHAQETKYVAGAKALVALVLLVATGVTAGVVYWFTSDTESGDFETRFLDFANQIVEVSQMNVRNVFETFETASIQVSAYGDGTDQSWPNMIIPHFEAEFAPIINHTGANYVTLTPFVTSEQRASYEEFVQNSSHIWIERGKEYNHIPPETELNFRPEIWGLDFVNGGSFVSPADQALLAPASHIAPLARRYNLINYDGFAYSHFVRVYQDMIDNREVILSEVLNLDRPYQQNNTSTWPESFMAAPVFKYTMDRDGEQNPIVAAIVGAMPWRRFFVNLVPEGIEGIILVVKNTCDQSFSFMIEGPRVQYMGPVDYQQHAYGDLEVEASFTAFRSLEDCQFSMHLYPSKAFRKTYETKIPLFSTLATVAIFILTTGVFVLYDCLVERRQLKVVTSANRSNAIISSLFPDNVRDRLMHSGDAEDRAGEPPKKDKKSPKHFLNRYAAHIADGIAARSGSSDHTHELQERPIADFFPSVTVLFADLAGFTAWSSTREPAEVFTLLEALYGTFDKLARGLGVFKVETIGDCYVAACGLPEPRADHAVVMFRFSRHCLSKMKQLVTKLSVKLGPETAELRMRFGLHSGPVTAGVLRGEKSRFQLFGDTVNTASRMESSGIADKIQLSQQAADELARCGKQHWYTPRSKKVHAKGKGELQTYLGVETLSSPSSKGGKTASKAANSGGRAGIDKSSHSAHGKIVRHRSQRAGLSHSRALALDAANKDASSTSIVGDDYDDDQHVTNDDDDDVFGDQGATASHEYEFQHHVEWNIETLQLLLKNIIAMRHSTAIDANTIRGLSITEEIDGTVLDEVKEIIHLPNKMNKYKRNPNGVQLPTAAQEQLRDYVQTIAKMYHSNPFHSFAHASHVVQSVRKLLSRIVAPKIDWEKASTDYQQYDQKAMHDFTFGITSDPITQFACIFAALIHDVDHAGVPNTTLIKEKREIAVHYKNKSVAEQNSIDLGWSLLFEPRYADLRACIYSNQHELDRFRQLVVNSIIATDIMDGDQKQMRNARWHKAFFENGGNAQAHAHTAINASRFHLAPQGHTQVNRKATIVIEHIIQASDIAHTMQHWHIYLKWNEKLFDEIYKAHLAGRVDKDPSDNWYEGELGFYDNYIIPLAKKLKECGVFGVSSDEYLNYAQANRMEWAMRGQEVVKGYLAKYDRS